jgi:hypothetical protein
MTQVNVQRGDRVLIVLQDRALIKQNRRPTVGELKTKICHRRGIKQIRLGATVKAKAFYGRGPVVGKLVIGQVGRKKHPHPPAPTGRW